jgi:hypothetical protein
MFMERLMPNKTEVLSSLSNGTHLDRWARVVVYQKEDWGMPRGALSEWMVSFQFPSSPSPLESLDVERLEITLLETFGITMRLI